MDRPVVYEITIGVIIDAKWSGWFSGMTIVYGTDAEGSPVTILRGTVVDQSALHGILTRIGDLGLPIISVNRLSYAAG